MTANRVLIIGCGAIAGGYDAERSPEQWPLSHAGAIARDDRFEIVACVDPNEAARTTFAKRWDVAVAAASLEALESASFAFDLIVVASPTSQHAAHLDWALGMRPKVVFCEKPLARDIAQVRRISHAFDMAKIPLVVNYSRRWMPDLNALHDEIVGDEWGHLLSAVGTYSKGVVHNGTHMLDLMMMFEMAAMQIGHVGPAFFDHWDEDPTVSALLFTGEGTPVHLVAGDSRAVTQFELVLNFSGGEIAIRDGGMRLETRRVIDSETFAGYRTLGPVHSVAGRYPEAMSAAYDNLAGVIARKAYPAWGKRNGFAAHEICEEIRLTALRNLKDERLS